MGERIRADIQAAYELRSSWKIKDAISGFVIETDGASKFSTTATAAEIGLDQKLSASALHPGGPTFYQLLHRPQVLEPLLSITL
jgi:hypothetical protein